MMSETLQERLAIHELVRTGYARQEDLRFLQDVVEQGSSSSLSSAAVNQLVRECRLREEWRVQKELTLLQQLASLVLLTDAEATRFREQSELLQAQRPATHPSGQPGLLLNNKQAASSTAAVAGAQQPGKNLIQHSPAASLLHTRHSLPEARGAIAASSLSSAISLYGGARPGTSGSGSSHSNKHQVGVERGAPQPKQLQRASSTSSVTRAAAAATEPMPSPARRLPGKARGLHRSQSQAQRAAPQLLTPEQLRQQLSGSGTPPASPASRPLTSPSLPQAQRSPSTPSANGPAAGTVTARHASKAGAIPEPAGGQGRPRVTGTTITPVMSGPGPPNGALSSFLLPPKSPQRASRGTAKAAQSPAQPKRASVPVHATAQGGGHDQKQPGSSGSSGRFQMLLRLNGTLLHNLHEHAASDGTSGAHAALVANVNEMQSHFSACIQEAQQLLGIRGGEGGPEQQGGGGGGGAGNVSEGQHQSGLAARAANFRRQRWERLLQLGQLGLTGADIGRLQHLRRQQAARCIQRQVRIFLQRVRAARAIEAARQKAARAAARLRDAAARVIQRHWRGLCGRRIAATARSEARLRARLAAVEYLKQGLAATRIQRAWRLHRKRLQAARVRQEAAQLAARLGLSQPEVSLIQTAASGKGKAWGGAQATPQPMAHGSGAAAALMLQEGHSHTASVTLPPLASIACPASSSGTTGGTQQPVLRYDNPAHAAAATRIQAAVRGWLARRRVSSSSWWTGAARSLQARRSRARSWAAHHKFMVSTYGLQEQLVGVILHEAGEAQQASVEMALEAAQLEAHWGAWLDAQMAAALAQPLPKGWVPHPHPQTGQPCFLDTRTGALHAHHPAMLELKSFAEAEHERASAKATARRARVAAYLQQLHRASTQEQARLMGAMHAVLKSQLSNST